MRKLFATFACSAFIVIPMSSFAAATFDIPSESLFKQSVELQQRLNLTANQRLLWFQVEAKAKDIVRERQARRDRLQSELRTSLTAPGELRELSKQIAIEEETALKETRRLRELWLDLDDALEEPQRARLHVAMWEQISQLEGAQVAPKTAARPDQNQGSRRNRNGGGGATRF